MSLLRSLFVATVLVSIWSSSVIVVIVDSNCPTTKGPPSIGSATATAIGSATAAASIGSVIATVATTSIGSILRTLVDFMA